VKTFKLTVPELPRPMNQFMLKFI